MSTLNLSQPDLEALRALLGADAVPDDPESQAFTDAVALVMRSDPELAQRYILSVPIGSDDVDVPPLRVEQEARAARGRQRVLNLQRVLFMRQVEDEWIASQPKIWTFTIVALVVGLALATTNYVNHLNQRPAVVEQEPEPVEVPVEPVVELSLPEPEPAAAPRLSLDNFPALAPAPTAMPPLAQVQPTTPPASAPPANLPPLLPPAPVASNAGTLEYNPHDPDELSLPITVAQGESGARSAGFADPLGVYRQSELPPAAPGAIAGRSLTTYRDAGDLDRDLEVTTFRDAPPAGEALPLTSFAAPATFGASAPAAASMVAFSATAATTATNSTPTLWRQGGAEPGSLTIASARSDSEPQGSSGVVFTRESASSDALTTDMLVAYEPITPTQEPSAPANAPMVGDRLPARLVTSATVLDGQPGPVVVETLCHARDVECAPVVFFGSVTLLGGNRLVVALDRMLVDGALLDTNAIVLAPDLSTSLPAVLMDEAATLANDMFQSAISGVARYVDALASQTRLTVVDGQVLQESVVPPMTNFVAGNVAGLFNTRQNRVSFVRVAEIPAGTDVVVLVGASY